MIVKISELRCGDLIKTSWLGTYKGSEWHTVLDVYSSSNSNKIRINIEGYGSKEFDKDETIEKQ